MNKNKIMKYGTGSFITGVFVVLVSLGKNIFVSADTTLGTQVENAFKASLIIGAVLIVVSVILFMIAGSGLDKNE